MKNKTKTQKKGSKQNDDKYLLLKEKLNIPHTKTDTKRVCFFIVVDKEDVE